MDLTPYLLAWRTTPLRDREVVDALVHPAHAGPSPELARALAEWPGIYYWADEPDGRHLVLTRAALFHHAATTAREYGLPAVINVREATSRIPDRTWITLDGTTGEIRLEAESGQV